MQAWQYITVTCHAKNEFTSIQYTGIHYALNEIIRQSEDNNLVGLIEKCDFEENIFFLGRIYIIWMIPLYLIGYSVRMYKAFYFCMDIQTDANVSKPAERGHSTLKPKYCHHYVIWFCALSSIFCFLLFVWLLLVFSPSKERRAIAHLPTVAWPWCQAMIGGQRFALRWLSARTAAGLLFSLL